MEFALVVRELARRRVALAVGVFVATIAAFLSVYRLDGFWFKSRSLLYSSASTRVFVDTSSSVLGNLSQSFEPLQSRATAYANFMASPTVLDLVGQRVGLEGSQLYAAGPVDPLVPRIVQEPTAVQRNVQITGESTPYRLNFNSDPNLPTIGVYAQAPTTKMSIQLANAAVASLEQYVTSLENADNIPQKSRVVIRQLGEANGGVVDGGISKALALIVFVVVFIAWCLLTLLVVRFNESWRASATGPEPAYREPRETQLRLRTPARRTGAPEPELGGYHAKAKSGDRVSAAEDVAEPHARLRASGSQ